MKRLYVLTVFFVVFSLVILAKLFFLQIISADKYSVNAENQHFSALDIPARRGEISTIDSFPLAANQKAYLVYGTLPDIKTDKHEIATKLAEVFLEQDQREALIAQESASSSASLASESAGPDPREQEKQKQSLLKEKENELYSLLTLNKIVWVPLRKKLDKDLMEKITQFHFGGIGFEEEEKRFYPEASVSSQLLGFVASDGVGVDKGYFGLEGFYNGELKGRSGRLKEEIDAQGRPILVGTRVDIPPQDGRNLVLNVDRSVQYIVENKLREGVKKFGAKSGSVLIMDPKTGAVLASASLPSYDPSRWDKYDKNLYRSPAISDVYEPGSTFKVITTSAAIDAGVLDTSTICPCTGPKHIGPYEIRTWNNKYNANSNIAQILEHSDNVGMVFVQERLGQERFLDYLDNFGFGKATGIDLEGESSGILRSRTQWEPIDLATASFGQGHSVTMIQMVRAVSAIANGGNLMQPQLVHQIVGKEKTIDIKPRIDKTVIKRETASTVTELMVQAVENGEARYFVPKGYRIAGKTGTAQVPIEGHYDPTKTIASFIGFAPADDPKFVMLVKIDEPTSSPWGSETAAPLFFDIAKQLFSYWGIAPNR